MAFVVAGRGLRLVAGLFEIGVVVTAAGTPVLLPLVSVGVDPVVGELGPGLVVEVPVFGVRVLLAGGTSVAE